MELSSDEVRNIEIEITNRAKNLNTEAVENLKMVLANKAMDYTARREAFWLLLTWCRRNKDLPKCLDLYLSHKKEFGGEFLTKHFYSIVLSDTNEISNLQEAIEHARNALKINPWYTGALHHLARTLSSYIELAQVDGKERDRCTREGLRCVNRALSIEPKYAKFYSTRAKIKGQMNSFDAAQDDIALAIDLEDSQSVDYPIRISDYIEVRNFIELRRLRSSVKDEISELIEEALADSKKLNIQILTLFVAVISFIFGGITIATNYTFMDAARLMFVLSAALLISLSGFGILYDRKVSFQRLSIAILFSVALLATASYVDLFLK